MVLDLYFIIMYQMHSRKDQTEGYFNSLAKDSEVLHSDTIKFK